MRFAAVLLVLSSACMIRSSSSAPQKQHLPEGSTFTLIVSNQSFDADPVNLEIKLDGQLAVTGDFFVGSQHTFKQFNFDLAPGTRTLMATAEGDAAEIGEWFAMDDRKWAVVMFWFDAQSNQPAKLTLNLLDEAPAFD